MLLICYTKKKFKNKENIRKKLQNKFTLNQLTKNFWVKVKPPSIVNHDISTNIFLPTTNIVSSIKSEFSDLS